MFRFALLAVIVTLALQPFPSVGTNELQESSQKRLEQFIGNIPEDGIRIRLFDLYQNKSYEELEDAIDIYVEHFVDFSDDEADKEEDALSNKELTMRYMSELVRNSADVAKTSEYVDVPRKPLTVSQSQAMHNMKKIIATYVEEDMQEKANKLLADEKYVELEDFVLENMRHMRDITSDALNNLSMTMTALMKIRENQNEGFVEDSTLPVAAQKKREQLRKTIADHVPEDKQAHAYALLSRQSYLMLMKFILDNTNRDEVKAKQRMEGKEEDGVVFNINESSKSI